MKTNRRERALELLEELPKRTYIACLASEVFLVLFLLLAGPEINENEIAWVFYCFGMGSTVGAISILAQDIIEQQLFQIRLERKLKGALKYEEVVPGMKIQMEPPYGKVTVTDKHRIGSVRYVSLRVRHNYLGILRYHNFEHQMSFQVDRKGRLMRYGSYFFEWSKMVRCEQCDIEAFTEEKCKYCGYINKNRED